MFGTTYEEVGIDNRLRCPILQWVIGNNRSFEVFHTSRILRLFMLCQILRMMANFFINVYRF